MSDVNWGTVIYMYDKKLQDFVSDAKKADGAVHVERATEFLEWANTDTRLSHIRWMLHEMSGMDHVDHEHTKFHRWLGFVQGALWSEGIYSIDEMREHNRRVLK